MNTNKKRGRGRPFVDDPRRNRVYRATDDEYNEIAEAADRLQVSIAEFTRQTLLRRARRVNAKQTD